MIARGFHVVVAAVAVLAVAACPGKTGPDPVEPTTGNTAPKVVLVPGTIADLKGDVVEIDVVGLDDERTKAARAALVSTVGKAYDAIRISDDVHALWQIAGVRDIKVDGRVIGSGVGLRYTIATHPRVTSVEVRGTKAFAADHLIEHMDDLRRGAPADPAAVAQVRAELIDQYKELGHALVEVETAIEHGDAGDRIVFDVNEGPALLVSQIEFKGAVVVKRAILLALLAKDGGSSVGGRFFEAGLERGLLNITAHYYDVGYINARIDTPVVTPAADRTSVSIAVTIEEGDQYKVSTPTFKGTLLAPEKEYARLLGVKNGEVFSRTRLTAGLDRIRAFHDSKGQHLTGVVPLTEIDAKKKRVKLTVEISGATASPP